MEADKEALKALPTGLDPESSAHRRKLWLQADYNGNGIISLAEADRLIVSVLRIKGVDKMKPVINRAFHAARDIVPPVGDFSKHYIDFHQFRYFLIYLSHYLELFLMFAVAQQSAGERYSDRRLSFKEFKAAVPHLLAWGVSDSARLRKTPEAVFREIDVDGGGVVLFDEFAHWALFNHIGCIEGAGDEDMAEALDVLRKQKPNLCSRDLEAINAGRARFRADGPIKGQGAMRGDSELAGAYAPVPDGAKELAEGRPYPGGVAHWKASFERTEESCSDAGGPKLCTCGCGRPAFSHFNTCCNKCKGPDGPHARDCEGKGYASCKNGCGRLPFGRFDTCCTRCSGTEGPHARDCLAKAIESLAKRGSGSEVPVAAAACAAASAAVIEADDNQCINGCGRLRFRHFKTCCTHCKGADGPHARDCLSKDG